MIWRYAINVRHLSRWDIYRILSQQWYLLVDIFVHRLIIEFYQWRSIIAKIYTTGIKFIILYLTNPNMAELGLMRDCSTSSALAMEISHRSDCNSKTLHVCFSRFVHAANTTKCYRYLKLPSNTSSDIYISVTDWNIKRNHFDWS